MKKWIIYCRVSTKKQQSYWASLENQEKACKEYCLNTDIVINWIFKEAFTWTQSKRPEFEKAIRQAKKDKVNYFIIYDIDRFSREWYDIYIKLKNELRINGIQLKDSKSVIWETIMVAKNEQFDMSKYDWNFENPSEYAEVFLSTQALSEARKIKQRTIPREIELEQMGYSVRQPNYWYINKSAPTPDWKKAKIQIMHPIEWEWVIEMFEKRAKWIFSDKEIVEELNKKWCKRRSGLPLNVKYLQEIIVKTVYAGVISTEWTWNKPIKTAYDWLVNIDTWNKANRWKVKIIDLIDEVLIEYNNWKTTIINKEVKEKRRKYNSYYPYSKVLKCPICQWVLTANTSKSRSGKLHYYYQCRGKDWAKHSTYTVKREDSHNKILNLFKLTYIDKETLSIFNELCKEVFQEQEQINSKNLLTLEKNIEELNRREKEIFDSIEKFVNYPAILEAKNKEIEDIKIEKYKIKEELENSEINVKLQDFRKYATKLITHLDQLAKQKENQQLINLAFEIVFWWKTEYEKLSYHTPFFDAFCPNLRQQKNPQEEDLDSCLKWQPH